ncbi:YajG family lipoprotein [Candidatus Gillettellia adelgis]
MLKQLYSTVLGTLLLFGCTTNSNRLNVMPTIILPQPVSRIHDIKISIDSADRRQDQTLAKISSGGTLITLQPMRNLRFLLQEGLEQQMDDYGYIIDRNSNINVQIVINNLYADVFQGNLRYNIVSKANISVIAQAKNGNQQIKSYCTTYNTNGVFLATRNNITRAINNTLNLIFDNIAKDTSMHDFIKKNIR